MAALGRGEWCPKDPPDHGLEAVQGPPSPTAVRRCWRLCAVLTFDVSAFLPHLVDQSLCGGRGAQGWGLGRNPSVPPALLEGSPG